MSKLKIALYKRMYEIAIKEKRYFDLLDFVPKFSVDGQIYQISYGTFRNYISEFVRVEKVEVVQYSPQAFYTLKGVSTGNLMTRPHTGSLLMQNRRRLSNHPVYKIIQNLPFEKIQRSRTSNSNFRYRYGKNPNAKGQPKGSRDNTRKGVRRNTTIRPRDGYTS